METLVAILIVAAAGAFAIWFAKDQAEKRQERLDGEAATVANELSNAAGLASGDTPMWLANSPDGSIESTRRRYFDEGTAHNSKHITPEFRAIFWREKARGKGDAEAVQTAMARSCWRRDSQGQVFDRLSDFAGLPEGTRERWKAELAAHNIPGGFGTYGSGGC